MFDFFAIVEKMNDLYVTFRKRYVVSANGCMYIPLVKGTREPVVLTNKDMICHLNQKYAIAVYAGSKSSKFVCFDVDVHDESIVHRIIDKLEQYGFPRNKIYVSTSGGKGYHIEMFFTDLIFTKTLLELYHTMCRELDLDEKKVEFRPTSGLSIKLPLSKHYKTGKVCYFLDRETLEEIKDISYVLQIEKINRDFAVDIIEKNCKMGIIKDANLEKEEAIKKSQCKQLTRFESSYPMLTNVGQRHSTMLSIAIHERYKNTPPDEIEKLLIEWVDNQNENFITDTRKDVLNDAAYMANWVWRDDFKLKSRTIYLNDSDIDLVLSRHCGGQKKVLFLLMLHCRKFGRAKMSVKKMSEFTKLSTPSIKKIILQLEKDKIITRNTGKKHYVKDTKNIISESNEYKVCFKEGKKKYEFQYEDICEENFMNTYLDTMSEYISSENYFTRSEIEEIENYKIKEIEIKNVS